jgi:hypothetical protein
VLDLIETKYRCLTPPNEEFFKKYLSRFGCFVFTNQQLVTLKMPKKKTGKPKDEEKKELEVLAYAVVEFNHIRSNMNAALKTNEKEEYIEGKDHACAIIHLMSEPYELKGANMNDDTISRATENNFALRYLFTQVIESIIQRNKSVSDINFKKMLTVYMPMMSIEQDSQREVTYPQLFRLNNIDPIEAPNNDKATRGQFGFSFDIDETEYHGVELKLDAERHQSIGKLRAILASDGESKEVRQELDELLIDEDYRKSFTLFGQQKYIVPPIFPEHSAWVLKGDASDTFNHGDLKLVPQKLSHFAKMVQMYRTTVEADLRQLIEVPRNTDLSAFVTYLDPHAVIEIQCHSDIITKEPVFYSKNKWFGWKIADAEEELSLSVAAKQHIKVMRKNVIDGKGMA